MAFVFRICGSEPDFLISVNQVADENPGANHVTKTCHDKATPRRRGRELFAAAFSTQEKTGAACCNDSRGESVTVRRGSSEKSVREANIVDSDQRRYTRGLRLKGMPMITHRRGAGSCGEVGEISPIAVRVSVSVSICRTRIATA